MSSNKQQTTYGTCPLSDVVHVPPPLRCFSHDMWTLSSAALALWKARGDDFRLYHPSFARTHYQLICHSWTMKRLVMVGLCVWAVEKPKSSIKNSWALSAKLFFLQKLWKFFSIDLIRTSDNTTRKDHIIAFFKGSNHCIINYTTPSI